MQSKIDAAQTPVPLPGDLVVHLPTSAFDQTERIGIGAVMRMVEILANVLGKRITANVLRELSDEDTIRAAAAYFGEHTMSLDLQQLKARLSAILTRPDRRGMEEAYNLLCSGSHCDPASRPHSYDSPFFLAQADPEKTAMLHAMNGLYRYDGKKAVFDTEAFKQELQSGTPDEADVASVARARLLKGPRYDNDGKAIHGQEGLEWAEDLRRNYAKLKDAAFDLFFQLLANVGDEIREDYIRPGNRLYDLNTMYQDKELQLRKFFGDHFKVQDMATLNSLYDLWDLARGEQDRSAPVEDLFAD